MSRAFDAGAAISDNQRSIAARHIVRASAAAALCVTLPACVSLTHYIPRLPRQAIRPIIAVTEFENHAGFSGNWKLGKDISYLLIAKLVDTERFTVVDWRNLGSVVSEIKRQCQDIFQKEGSVERVRLANARYLVTGVIFEFTQTGNSSGWFRSPKAGVGGRGERALVSLQISVTDMETGEIISCANASASVKASGQWESFDYRRISIGGDMFNRSPLGEATSEAIHKAVYKIVKDIPLTYWQPRVAEVSGEVAIINGGRDRRIRPGAEYLVYEESRGITDPFTGNLIGNVPGKAIGKLRVIEVREHSANAVVLSGSAKRGAMLEPVHEK